MRSRVMDDGGDPSPQLSFQLVNSAGGATTPDVIFITEDATYNQISLEISLTSGATTLAPGTIPDPAGPPPATGTTLYLDLSSLELGSAVWDAMMFEATGWSFRKFASQGVVGMTPTHSIPLTPGTSGAIGIAIGSLVIPRPLASPQVQLYVTYYNIPNVQGMYSSFAVAIQNRPDDKSKDLSQAIGVSLTGNGIVNSIPPLLIANNLFSLQLASTQKVAVKAGAATELTISFVYGAADDPYGYGALTDVTSAKSIVVAAGANAEHWKITANLDGQSPSWMLQPPEGAAIVGTGVQSIVGIDFTMVATTYQAGPTAMLVSYSNVPGYFDGTYALTLNKIAHAQVKSLSVTPNPTVFSGGTANVTVKWSAAAIGLELTQNAAPTIVTGLTSLPVVLATETTTFGLTATGTSGTVPNVDYLSVQAVALPVINSFIGSPTEIYSGSLSHDAAFAWAVDSPSGIALSSTGGAFSGQQYDATGRAVVSIQQPQMVTLSPQTAVDPLTLTRRLVISAFTPTPASYPLAFTPAAVVASPTGPFVALAGPGNSLTVADTVQYALGSSLSLGHPPSAIAFSADGGTLATANTDSTISIVTVGLDPHGLPLLTGPSTVKVSAVPQQLLFAPRGPRIFATLDPGSGDPGSVVSLLWSQGKGYQVEATVTVGVAPRGLCLDAAGMRLFVACSGDDTASMIGLTSAGGLGTATTIHALTGGPTGIAATGSGQQLLVSCATAGTVIVVDPNHPDTGQRNTLTVGKAPGQLAITPSGAYAFVTNTGDGTLSLLNTWGLPASASVLGSPIRTGASPSGLSTTPDGLQVLVANAGGFTLVGLATYTATPTPVPTPNRPTSVEVVPDGSVVFAWHDTGIPAASPSPGILVYTQSSGQLSNLLASQQVLRCVASPDPLAKAAYAIVQGDPQLYVIATDKLTTTTMSLGLAVRSSPVALAISGEGDTLFVVAADASNDLSLVVLQRGRSGWTTAQTLPLYRGTANGRFLLRCTPDTSTLFLVDVAGSLVRALVQGARGYALSSAVIPGDASALDLAILPDGSTAYVLNAGTSTSSFTVIDIASLTSYISAVPQSYVNLTAVQPSPDGRRLFATDSNAAALRMLDPASLRIVQTIPLAAAPADAAGANGLAVMPDGSKIFTANTVSQTVSIIDQIQMGTSLAATHGTRQLALARKGALDDTYSGLFMRHYLTETPGAPADGWSGSPDIIPYGQQIAPDLTIFTTPAGYAKDYGANVYLQNPNYVYVRGLNTTAAPITSRAYFYYTQSNLALWPADWVSDAVTVKAKPQNWVDITAPAVATGVNGVGVAPVPLVWTPPTIVSPNHYCVIAWVDNSSNPQPPDFASYSKFATGDDLVQFVITHHNMAWRNTSDYPTVPPDFMYSTGLTMKSGGGTVFLSITFPNVPLDGSIAVTVQGTGPNNSVNLAQASLQGFHGGYTPGNNPLVFPANFATSVQVQHWPGPTPVPPNAQINVTAAVQTAPALTRDIERMYRPMGLRSPIRRFGGFPAVIIGTTMFNLKFGSAKTPALETTR